MANPAPESKRLLLLAAALLIFVLRVDAVSYCSSSGARSADIKLDSDGSTDVYMRRASGLSWGANASCKIRVAAHSLNRLRLQLVSSSLAGYEARVRVYNGDSSGSPLLWTISPETAIGGSVATSGANAYITISTSSESSGDAYGAILRVTQLTDPTVSGSIADGSKEPKAKRQGGGGGGGSLGIMIIGGSSGGCGCIICCVIAYFMCKNRNQH